MCARLPAISLRLPLSQTWEELGQPEEDGPVQMSQEGPSMDEDWDDDELDSLQRRRAERVRLDAEWVGLIALRDTFGIAVKGDSDRYPTYRATIAIGQVLAPGLYGPETSVLYKEEFSQTARTYIQEAKARSKLEQREVSAVDLMRDEIRKFDALLATETAPNELNMLRKRIDQLRDALEEVLEVKNTENMLIFRDAYQVERDLPVSHKGRDYREFRISDKRALRIRVLHPDKAEHATGADLSYESYWDTAGKLLVRLAAVQYKLWHDKSLFIDPRMQEQLDKLNLALCERGMCREDDQNRRPGAYRLPHCSAFLRPSDARCTISLQ